MEQFSKSCYKQSQQSKSDCQLQAEHQSLPQSVPLSPNEQLPSHLQNTPQIGRIREYSLAKLTECSRLRWEQQERAGFEVQIIQTNFQSMRVRLRYGHFGIDISVLWTEIDQRVFEDGVVKKGAFGVVRFVEVEGRSYAVKGIKLGHKNGHLEYQTAYKQYFMCCLADILEVGPKIPLLFGYDIFLTKSFAFFPMQHCSPPNPQSSQSQTLRSQLLESLQILHSLQLIHNDIKPENIAFSPTRNKHVFLDYGLSKIVKEQPGFKTKTRFEGTLTYCSDEMKKCYMMRMARFVDLYQNDLVCLERSLVGIGREGKMERVDKGQEDSEHRILNDSSPIFQLLTQISNLKYYIFTQNPAEILRILQSSTATPPTQSSSSFCSSTTPRKHSPTSASTSPITHPLLPLHPPNPPRILYQILTTQPLPEQISQHAPIKAQLQLMKCQIMGPLYQVGRIDSIMCDFFNTEKRVISAEKIIPISQIVGMGEEFFGRYLVEGDLVLKLFWVFDPFLGHFGEGNLESRAKLKQIIIQKIYQLRNPEPLTPIFFSQKLRFTILFFYQKLKASKNLRVMLSLRMLLVSALQMSLKLQIQQEIIEMIEEPFLKLLKIAQFTLYHYSFQNTDGLDWRWRKEVEGLGNVGDGRMARIRKLLQIVMQPDIYEFYFTSWMYDGSESSNMKTQMILQIQKMAQECTTPLQKQSAYFIKYLYINVRKDPKYIYSRQPAKGLAIKIWSRFWKQSLWRPEYIQITEQEQKEQKLFRPLKLECRQYITLSKDAEIDQFMQKVQNQLRLLKSRNDTCVNFLYELSTYSFLGRNYLPYLIKQLRQSLNQCAASMEMPWPASYVYGITNSVKNLFTAIEKNEEYLGRNGVQNVLALYGELEQILDCVNGLDKFQQIIKDSKESQEYQIYNYIMQVKFALKKRQDDKLTAALEILLKLMQPRPTIHHLLVIDFFNIYQSIHIFTYLQSQPQPLFKHQPQPPSPQHQYEVSPCSPRINLLKKTYLQTFHKFLSQPKHKHLYIFQAHRYLIRDYIKMNNQQNNQQQNFKLILLLLSEYFGREDMLLNPNRESLAYFARPVEVFCRTLQKGKLADMYKGLRFGAREGKDALYAFLVFWMFIKVHDQFPLPDQLRQITRTTLYLKSMPALCQTLTKPHLIPQYRHLLSFKSKRKAFICHRLQIRNTTNEHKLKQFAKHVEAKTDKFSKKNEAVLEKIGKKIRIGDF